jgi:hypothetical protein
MSETKELIADYRKWRGEHAPIYIDGSVMKRVESFKFFSVHITEELTWSKPLLQNPHKKDYGLQLHMGTKMILSGEMSSGLMKHN